MSVVSWQMVIVFSDSGCSGWFFFNAWIAVLYVALDLFTSPGQDYEDLALTEEGIKTIRFVISMVKGFVFEVESGSLCLSLLCFST